MDTELVDNADTQIGQRGPADHDRRQQILTVAEEYFAFYGYSKTSVADLAKAVGVSSAYIYRFFASKQAIGEAVCRSAHSRIHAAIEEIAASQDTAASRLRKVFRCIVDKGFELFFRERKLHEITVVASQGKWYSSLKHRAIILDVVRKIVVEGRTAGEFERKTPLEEVCRAIVVAMTPFTNPMMLEEAEQEVQQEDVIAVANMVLRSLSV